MPLNINAQMQDGKVVNCILRMLPDKCPNCNQHGQPDYCFSAYTTPELGKPLFAVFRCPVSNCRALYVATYGYVQATNPLQWHLQSTSLSRYLEKQTFPKNIETISPLFCLTFNQALVAEENKLDQISGPGYRKALEFLVKDYLVGYLYKDETSKQEEVKRAFLANAIEKHIDQERIKQCAKRAVWLGNDEVHYTRKWDDKDIHDLKSLILMTVNHIDLTIESDRYLKEMPA
jgi:hypothetical protein